MPGAGHYPVEPIKQLVGVRLPDVSLTATDGSVVNPSLLNGITVIYVYPRTSPPDGKTIPGWSDIPGAKGCIPQSCSFRDHHSALQNAGAAHVFGLSTQPSKYQQEVVQRLNLPFNLLSDVDLAFQRDLALPIFEAEKMVLLHRVTFVARDAVIENVFHSINDPAANADAVLDYLTRIGI